MNKYKKSGNLALAPTGGIVGAVIGGAMWAKFITQLSAPLSGILTALIGVFCGLGVMLASRERNWITGLTAAIFTIFGILLGKYLQLRWNFVPHLTQQLMQQNEGLSREAAEKIAKVQREGYSTWELIRQQTLKRNLFSYAGTVVIGFLTAWSRTIYEFINKARIK